MVVIVLWYQRIFSLSFLSIWQGTGFDVQVLLVCDLLIPRSGGWNFRTNICSLILEGSVSMRVFLLMAITYSCVKYVREASLFSLIFCIVYISQMHPHVHPHTVFFSEPFCLLDSTCRQSLSPVLATWIEKLVIA